MSDSYVEEPAEQTADWLFFNGGPSAPRYGGDPTKHALDHDTETFVREVLQNSNDQRIDDERVDVRFRFNELAGAELNAFLDAIKWERGLRPRLEAVAKGRSGDHYTDVLRTLGGEDRSLRLLTIEDRNTTGLTGEWGDDSNFAALVRDELYSSKQTEAAGGSYGVGKSVLWTFSAASTVLFNSRPLGRHGGRANRTRLIGRTKLPTHQFGPDSEDYQGAGWLCTKEQTPNGVRPAAIEGDRAETLAERLRISRSVKPGTSAMVVGFRDPTRDEQPSISELVDEFAASAAKYFWPAIYRGDLRVVIEAPDREREVRIDDHEIIRPFVECYADRYSEASELNAPGDVAGFDIPFPVPDRHDDRPVQDGQVRIAARLASPGDDETLANHVALFRGAGMVVKYLDQRRVAFGDRDFHAVLAAGTSRGVDEVATGDRSVERFLRFAEPPSHDDWESTENLRSQYEYGFRSVLESMFDEVREALRHLIARPTESDGARIDRLGSQFPIHGDGSRRRLNPARDALFDIDASSRFVDGRWEFDGRVEPLEHEEAWSVRVELATVTEEGRADRRVPLHTVTATPATAAVEVSEVQATIRQAEPGTAVEFSGATVAEGERSGSADLSVESRLQVEVTLTEPGAGDDDE